ncbi:MAG: ATP-binding cassette domain-containing protein [Deltaproteobacteria bacterium]|nr:ATP-binding cassette domain-containing protein [Deltaproteobacteria bacterium]
MTIRRLLSLARPERNRLLLGTFFLLLGSVAGLLYPQGIKQVIDGAASPAARTQIDHAAIFMGIIALAQAAAIGLRAVLFSVAGESVVTRLREQLYRRILDQEIAFFDERRTGELTNRLASDTTVLQSAVSANISMVLRNGAQVLGGVGFLFWTSPILTLLMLAVVPPIAIGAVLYGRGIRKLSKDVQDALAQSNEVAEESISGIRTVRAFAAENNEGNRYASAVWRSFGLAQKRARAGGFFISGATFAGFGAVALVFWYGSRLVAQGALTVGQLSSFLVYTLMVAFALGALADLWADFMKALGAAERVFEILDRKPEIAPTGGLAPGRPRGHLGFHQVWFAYPTRKDVPVLRGLELTLKEGEVVALVGASGAGKSTVGSLMLRLYDPTLPSAHVAPGTKTGEITLDGIDLRELDPQWLRRQIGTVAQEPILFSASIAENIRYGKPEATDAEIEAAARASHAHDFVSKFPQGYATLVGERGVQLSGGQKQRVAIARAVLKDPRILLLDEATSALDAESESLVRDALEKLMKGRTTLIIAHRLSTVVGADRVVVLDGGSVVESGRHAELMQREGPYKKLVEKQFQLA